MTDPPQSPSRPNLALARQLVNAAHSFRLGRFAEGNDAWAASAATLASSLTPDLAQGLAGPLQTLLAAQERGDTALMADLLEYVIAPQFTLAPAKSP